MRTLAVLVAALAAACALRAGGRQAARGERLFLAHGCNGCHTVGVTGTPIGPPLDHVGRAHDRAWLAQWLRDPASQRPKAHMPPIAEDARDVAAYLSTLR